MSTTSRKGVDIHDQICRQKCWAGPGHSGQEDGARTARGKAASSKNARKHGLTSKDALIPGESAKEFQALRTQLWETFKPVGALEEELVERVLICMWRLRRAYRVETSIYAQKFQEFDEEPGGAPLS